MAAAEVEESRAGWHCVREQLFAQVRALYDAGRTATAITEELGLRRRRVDRWIRLEALPRRNVAAPTSASPSLFLGHLTRRWAEGCTVATRLFTEISASATRAATRISRASSPHGGAGSRKGLQAAQ